MLKTIQLISKLNLYVILELELKYYIVLTRVHAERLDKESKSAGELPKSDLTLLAETLNASFIVPESYQIKLIDKIRANLAGTPENWAYARVVSQQLQPDDIVFCPGEEIGIPLASMFANKAKKPKIIVWFHRITGIKARLSLKLFNTVDGIDLAVVSSRPNKRFLENYLNLSSDRILFWWHPINAEYFAPKISASNIPRPLIVSSGLEQRDYRLLAAATEDLDVDVKVAGFSQFQSRTAKNFPRVIPQNMSNQRYSLPELVELYHAADVVAVCLRENNGTSGVTVLLEAMACGKAVVCTRTTGLSDYLDDETAIKVIEPGDVAGLKSAILELINDRAAAKERGERAIELAKERSNVFAQVDILAKFIRTLDRENIVSFSKCHAK